MVMDFVKPKVGDRVVVIAKPTMTTAELLAIWQVEHIGKDGYSDTFYGTLYAKGVGRRTYPLEWIRIYSDNAMEEPNAD